MSRTTVAIWAGREIGREAGREAGRWVGCRGWVACGADPIGGRRMRLQLCLELELELRVPVPVLRCLPGAGELEL